MKLLYAAGRRFILAFQFMTRIPITKQLALQDGDFPGCSVFFPAVGLVVGLIMAAFGWGLYAVTHSAWAAAGIAVLAGTMVTGGLHLDGLGDTADGVFSGRSRERALEIMKDSRSGSFGVIAIATDLLLKTGILAEAFQTQDIWISPIFLFILMPVFGRLGSVTAASLGKPARPDGSGRLFLEGVGFWHLAGAAILTALIGWYPLGLTVLIYMGVSLLAAWILNMLLTHRLGGLTGDCLGAANEVCEVFFLIAFSIMNVWR